MAAQNVTHYRSGKGVDVEIAKMTTRYLRNALAWLKANEPARAAEITALEAESATRPADPA